METGSKPRAPFWGFPLGLFPWTEQSSKTHMLDNILPCEAYHCRAFWQKRKGTTHTHWQGPSWAWGQALLDGCSGRRRDNSSKKVFFSLKCVFKCVHPGSCGHTDATLCNLYVVWLRSHTFWLVCLSGPQSEVAAAVERPGIVSGIHWPLHPCQAHSNLHSRYCRLFVPRPDGMLDSPLLIVPQCRDGMAEAICPN